MENNLPVITPDKFEFAQLDEVIHDKKLETKSRGYFADAFLRFKKNKSSVVAAIIIGFLVLFAIFAPILSPYTVDDKNNIYVNFAPFVKPIADMNIGLFDGGTVMNSQNQKQLDNLKAIGTETGLDPVIKIVDTYTQTEKYRGKDREVNYYKVRVNKYYQVGIRYMVLSYDEFERIQKFQDETGLQVIYPYVDPKDICGIDNNANIWYKVTDEKGTADTDVNGNRIPAYSTNKKIEGPEYHSIRIPGDDGSYIYSCAKSGSVKVRICYFNYYSFEHYNAETGDYIVPAYIFGTDQMGRDLFCAIGSGARFSLIFAVIVSAINLTIGAIYGAIQGYYGGVIDLILDRITDILSGLPSIVVITLFQLHLAQKVGSVPSFLFAYIATGWIGMAALTRKQFYRFKNQEHILAARTLGASDWRLMFKHIFPNAIGTIITSCVLVIPGVISSETTLTYLGIINLADFTGTSIGELMSFGQSCMIAAPHAMIFPALFVSLLLISFNLFGNGLRDAFNPTTRGAED